MGKLKQVLLLGGAKLTLTIKKITYFKRFTIRRYTDHNSFYNNLFKISHQGGLKTYHYYTVWPRILFSKENYNVGGITRHLPFYKLYNEQ